jgi:hypothetical protein
MRASPVLAWNDHFFHPPTIHGLVVAVTGESYVEFDA